MLIFALLAGIAAQPTFGPPKPGKRKPAQPKQVDPAPTPEPPMQGPETPASPDEPDQPSPMFEPGSASAAKFVPSPEEWLDSDPPRQAPSADVVPGATYAWRSSEGLRYSYAVPASYKPDTSVGYDMIIICHPRGDDFRWGMANHLSAKAAEERGSIRLAFRPDNFVICVDGVSASAARPKFRSFDSTSGALVQFRDFVLELTRSFPARRFYIYGFGGGDQERGDGGGGRFVLSFAAQFPALADGVIAYGCGYSDALPARLNTPVVIMHGVKNSVAPFSSARKLHSEYVEQGSKLVRLRALRAFNDFPNPVRVSECIDWLAGARTDDPAEALAAVESMLTPKGGDEYDYVCPVWYAGAREILGRILDEQVVLAGEAPFEGKSAPTQSIKDRASQIVRQLDSEAARHVAALRAAIPEPLRASDLVLDGEPWLGHLTAARDDFRGVAAMDAFAAAIDFDAALEHHLAESAAIIDDWTTRGDEENFVTVTAALPRCFLDEALPVDLTSKMKSWRRKSQSGELELPAESLEGFENVTNWDEGMRKGLDAYQRIWRQWQFTPQPANPSPK